MKIAYFHYLHGQDTALHHVHQFADAVRSLGHTISVHAMNLAPTDNGSIRNQVRNTLKRRLSPYLHELKELCWNPRYIIRELDIVRQEQPDVILSRTHFLTASCLAVAKRSGKPLVLEMNAPACESVMYFDEYLHLPLVGEFLERLTAQGAGEVIVVSEALRRYVASRYKLPLEKISANPNGADNARFHPNVDGSKVRQQFGLQGKKVIGFVGSLYRWHGPDLLRNVIDHFRKDHGVAFLLVGDGHGWEKFRELIASDGLRERVSLPGQVPHDSLPEYIAAMDVALLPESNFYGSPLKVIEYMATGIPTVAPRYGPLEEIIEHGREGLLFPPRNVKAALHSITGLLANAEMRQQMGLAAACKVTQSLTWRHNAEQVIAACQRALKQHKSRWLHRDSAGAV